MHFLFLIMNSYLRIPFIKNILWRNAKIPRQKEINGFSQNILGTRLEYGIIVGSRGCPYDCGFCAGTRSLECRIELKSHGGREVHLKSLKKWKRSIGNTEQDYFYFQIPYL